jgi:hypothetical protein
MVLDNTVFSFYQFLNATRNSPENDEGDKKEKINIFGK